MNKKRVELIKGDITSLDVDAIVNAANNSLLGGGGVDGAIHEAAGPDLLIECKRLNGCETGHAKITDGFRLKAKHVIHTVGPVWYGGYRDEQSLLAFSGISTGAYGFPKDLAALIAVNETKRFLTKNSYPEKVIFVTYGDDSYETYRKLLDQ